MLAQLTQLLAQFLLPLAQLLQCLGKFLRRHFSLAGLRVLALLILTLLLLSLLVLALLLLALLLLAGLAALHGEGFLHQLLLTLHQL